MKKHLVGLAGGILTFTACQAKDLTSPVVSSNASAMLLLPVESLVISACLAITMTAATLITTRATPLF